MPRSGIKQPTACLVTPYYPVVIKTHTHLTKRDRCSISVFEPGNAWRDNRENKRIIEFCRQGGGEPERHPVLVQSRI